MRDEYDNHTHDELVAVVRGLEVLLGDAEAALAESKRLLRQSDVLASLSASREEVQLLQSKLAEEQERHETTFRELAAEREENVGLRKEISRAHTDGYKIESELAVLKRNDTELISDSMKRIEDLTRRAESAEKALAAVDKKLADAYNTLGAKLAAAREENKRLRGWRNACSGLAYDILGDDEPYTVPDVFADNIRDVVASLRDCDGGRVERVAKEMVDCLCSLFLQYGLVFEWDQLDLESQKAWRVRARAVLVAADEVKP
jgi:hypothetical protein